MIISFCIYLLLTEFIYLYTIIIIFFVNLFSIVIHDAGKLGDSHLLDDLENHSPVAKPHILTIPCTSVHTMFFCILL